MGVIGAYDRNKEFDEILVPRDVGSGVVSVAQRQANAIANLGLTDTIAQLNLLAGATPGVVVDSIAAIYNATGGVAVSVAAVAATGSTQSNGAALTAEINAITAADGTKAVVLPATVVNTPIYVLNTNASNPLPVFPPSGTTINALSANAAFTLGPGYGAWFVPTTATQVYVSGLAAVTATPAELDVVHGVTAGTVLASAAVVVDASKNIGTFGEVSAAQFNASAGTATVAPITLAAGTNLTTAAAGAVEFDGTAFYATAIAASRQQVDAEQLLIATANSATYNNTGLDSSAAYQVFTATMNAAVTAGSISLAASKVYCFKFMYNLTNTGTTSHTWAVALGGTATFTTGNYQVSGISGTTASTPATGSLAGFISSTTLSTAVVATAASTSATEQVSISGQGTLVIANAGTIIPQLKASARPGASGTPGVIVLAGSYFRIWEMATAGAVGDLG